MSLAVRDTGLRELMDDPDCDPDRLAETLRRFDLVNRAVGGWGRVWRRGIRPRLQRLGRPARVLDVGSGGGDVVARLAAWAERDGLDVQWLGIDPDVRALEVARTRESERVSFASTDAAGLRASGERFDLVLSNHVLHHLNADELAGFADDTRALSTGVVMHADIARGRLAYALYGIGITALERGTFLRTDGLRSIRRSYRPGELEAALGAPWRVAAPAPFRLLAVADGRG
ncbi:methyltransferase domain-containing protein [Microbacterium sp. EYE_5]|uniref:methyltransferase domain-containing protein n=1 Tax=unclassified Microbacterium TaxID=2609290 RepID=UPI0020031981|nr:MULTISPECIES: methyltransferase domain-containing protein [unclassified Microbacterium]MCK6079343.1 methyltransferase domain-containing protein [Microbacterium sp. EYE_382]MCK6084613.1 methyltransferase domain-containing protein [Microbacterium sp. EYE_384]MCK6123158.1 methyltransferase domain-containing protein [Microbacterium sp. EYE_80]MCK6125377.1 methyltransferase domain-containing protein [Microbacterium sp. EYE_79]MCK6140297.1 methyltransferase domain-containing protein [Microbacteri